MIPFGFSEILCDAKQRCHSNPTVMDLKTVPLAGSGRIHSGIHSGIL